MARTKSTGPHELATTSALGKTTEKKRNKEPSSPASIVDESPLQHAKTRHRLTSLQRSGDMSLNVPKSSKSTEDHCSAATSSAISSIEQVKQFCKKGLKRGVILFKKRLPTYGGFTYNNTHCEPSRLILDHKLRRSDKKPLALNVVSQDTNL